MRMNQDATATVTSAPAGARRADAGTVRLSERDITGLVLCGEMYGAPYDLLAAALGVRDDRLRAIVARYGGHHDGAAGPQRGLLSGRYAGWPTSV